MRLTVPLRRPLGLPVADQSYNAAFGMLGVRFGHGFTWVGGQSVLTGYLARCLKSGRLNLGMTASFVGAPGSDFEAIGQGLAYTRAKSV